MKEVVVFFGGRSSEHDISVITGVFTLNSIDDKEFNVHPVYVHGDGKWYTGDSLRNIDNYKNLDLKGLKEVCVNVGDNSLFQKKKNKLKVICKIDVAINCLHGVNGEDGSLSGLLNLCFIPLSSPNIFSSALTMNKQQTKLFAKALKIPTPAEQSIERCDFLENKEDILLSVVNKLKYPIIVKPACCGSSIGISVAWDYVQLEACVLKAFEFDDLVICEKFYAMATDINCAAYKLSNEIFVSECEMPVTKNDILTFDDKYQNSKSGILKEFPAKIPKEQSDKIKEWTKILYKTLKMSGIVRMDFLIVGEKVFLNEINSVPGSLAYYLFCEKIADFKSLLTNLLNDAITSFKAYSNISVHFESNVLSEKFDCIKK